ncbi:MAG: TRAP transporter small permease [Desulfobacteraceae bacterium]|nr:TRAP transporter small permease [Desulfobacteraceae bacterium]
MHSFLNRISSQLNRIIEFSLFILGISMAIIVASQVFSRYVLNHSLFWSEELARYLLVWLTFLGATSAYKRNAHPGVDIFYIRMRAAKKKICNLIVFLASMTLFSVMIVYGFQFAYFIRNQITPALSIPKWFIFIIIPVSGMIFMIHCLANLMELYKTTTLEHWGKGRNP